MSIYRGKGKEDEVHRCNRILLGHKKEGNNTVCGNMDGPRDSHKVNQTEEKYHGITYMWNLNYYRNEPIHEIETDSQT